ncbi:hypothetical protein [[Kitasatospora] papulosa]|uniref:hypothetical protein n=1 Tax=[Kitasatospora] papulosa TaxID=1464011 RepID=UPI0036923D52
MITTRHGAMRRLLDKDPAVFIRPLRTLGIPFSDPVATALRPTDLTHTRLMEPRFDTLLQVAPADGDNYLLAFESAQTGDPARRTYWSSRLAYLHGAYRMTPVLLAICQDESTSRWARTPLVLGPRQWPALTFHPLVLGPHNVPVVTDARTAARDIPMASFSAMVHGYRPEAPAVFRALASALRVTDEDTSSVFRTLTERGLGAGPAAHNWRDVAPADPFSYRAESERRRLHADAATEGRREALLTVLNQRGIRVTAESSDRINACTDTAKLTDWLIRALAATTAEDLFEED